MLTRFRLENFKSYDDANIDLREMTFLVGANASGKSNLVEGLRLFAWLAQGRRLHEVHDALRSESLLLRGQGLALLHEPGQPLLFSSGVSLASQRYGYAVSLGVEERGMQIVGETLVAGQVNSGSPLFVVAAPAADGSNDIQVAYNNFSKGGKKPQIIASDQQTVLSQVLTPARFGDKHRLSRTRIPAAANAVRTEMEHILFLDPVPSQMRGYSVIEDRTLRPNGSNLSAVLFDLCSTKTGKARVLDFVRDLPEQNIKDIGFIETPRREVLVKLTESFGSASTSWDAGALSDGTLRVLAVAAAVLSVPEGSLVVIEELDNGLHPSRVRKLLDALDAVTKERKIQLLLTTHNPALLDAIPDSALPNVAFCYRDPTKGDSRITRLEDIEDYPSLVAQGGLGELLTRGLVDRFVKNPQTPDARRKSAEKWLEQISGAEA